MDAWWCCMEWYCAYVGAGAAAVAAISLLLPFVIWGAINLAVPPCICRFIYAYAFCCNVIYTLLPTGYSTLSTCCSGFRRFICSAFSSSVFGYIPPLCYFEGKMNAFHIFFIAFQWIRWNDHVLLFMCRRQKNKKSFFFRLCSSPLQSSSLGFEKKKLAGRRLDKSYM